MLHLGSIWAPTCCTNGLPGHFSETAKVFSPGVDVTKDPIPCACRPCTTTWVVIPTNGAHRGAAANPGENPDSR